MEACQNRCQNPSKSETFGHFRADLAKRTFWAFESGVKHRLARRRGRNSRRVRKRPGGSENGQAGQKTARRVRKRLGGSENDRACWKTARRVRKRPGGSESGRAGQRTTGRARKRPGGSENGRGLAKITQNNTGAARPAARLLKLYMQNSTDAARVAAA